MNSLHGKLSSTFTFSLFAILSSNSNCQFLNLPLIPQFFTRNLNETSSSSSKVCVHDIPTPIPFDDNKEYIHCFQETAKSRSSRHPDQDLRVNQLIVKYGYHLVTYNNVTTEDGYILTIFRISGSPISPPKKGKPAVLLYHGMGTASDIWVLQNDEQNNLAMKLVNEGYDVWMVNSRGTDFSSRHGTLSTKNIKYWDFSYHEMGIHDFPVVVDRMLSETGNERIFLICHSMGCGIVGIGISEMPHLNNKIEASVFLAPALFIGHTYCPLRVLSSLLELGPHVQRVLNLAVRGRIESGTPLMNLFQSKLCTPTALRCGVCGISLFFFYGYDAPQMDYTNIPNVISKFSNTQSFKSLIHLGQNFRSCMFRKYDYGRKENIRQYGQAEPPSYNLSNFRIPVYIYYADADTFVPPVDVIAARNALPSGVVKSFKKVQWKLFNHIDFMLAKDADILVYNDVLDVLRKYSKFPKR